MGNMTFIKKKHCWCSKVLFDLPNTDGTHKLMNNEYKYTIKLTLNKLKIILVYLNLRYTCYHVFVDFHLISIYIYSIFENFLPTSLFVPKVISIL